MKCYPIYSFLEDSLRNIDWFGLRINLGIGRRKINKNNYLTSKLGGFMTILFAIGLINIAGIEIINLKGNKNVFYTISDH